MQAFTSFTEQKDVFSSKHHRVWLDVQPLISITENCRSISFSIQQCKLIQSEQVCDTFLGYNPPVENHRYKESSWIQLSRVFLHASMHSFSNTNQSYWTLKEEGGWKTFLILLMLVECLKENYTIKRLGSGYAERVPGYTTNLPLVPAVNTSIMHWPIFI